MVPRFISPLEFWAKVDSIWTSGLLVIWMGKARQTKKEQWHYVWQLLTFENVKDLIWSHCKRFDSSVDYMSLSPLSELSQVVKYPFLWRALKIV